MSNNIAEKDLMMAESMIKLTAIENLLVKKGILTISELNDEIKVISQKIIDYANKLANEEVSKVTENSVG